MDQREAKAAESWESRGPESGLRVARVREARLAEGDARLLLLEEGPV
jgi:hypothetical protein